MITEQAAEFHETLPNGGVLMGLDLGTKTIGTAFCDAGWSFAGAGKTLPRGKFARDLTAIRALIAERKVKGIVLGLPLNMDGTAGPRAQATRAFARNLAPLGLPILLWDDRWSTASAERAMIAQDMSRAKRAERIDSHAAAVILQAAIDALAGGLCLMPIDAIGEVVGAAVEIAAEAAVTGPPKRGRLRRILWWLIITLVGGFLFFAVYLVLS